MVTLLTSKPMCMMPLAYSQFAPLGSSLLVTHVGMEALEFWYHRSAVLYSGKNGFRCQGAQTGNVQWRPAMIFFTWLTGEASEHRAVLRRGWNPVDTERGSHDGQSRYALTDSNMQGS